MNIAHACYWLPATRKTLTAMSAEIGLSNNEKTIFQRFYGLAQMPIDPNLTVEQALLTSVKQCLEDTKIRPDKIRWLIHTHTANPIAPFGHYPIQVVRERLHLVNAIAFSMSLNKCASAFQALKLSQVLLNSLMDNEYILVVIADVTFTSVLKYIPYTTIMSDGSGCLLLSRTQQQNQILAIQLEVYPEFSSGYWASKTEQQYFESRYRQILSDVIEKSLKQANITKQQVRWIFPHNVNLTSWQAVAHQLNIPIEKIYLSNVSNTGHCFGLDPFMNFCCAQQEQQIESGDYCVLATVGLGATFAALVLRV